MQAGVLNQGTVNATNICRNPSFEVDLSGWVSNGATLSRSSEWSKAGGSSAKLVTTSGGGLGDIRTSSSASSHPEGVIPGKTYTVSAYIRIPSAHTTASTASNTRQRRILFFYSLNGSTFTMDFGPQCPNVPGEHRVSHTVTVPAGATGSIFAVGCSGSSTDPNFVTYVDAILIQEGSSLNPYFDGSTANNPLYNFEWAGTANNSASLRRVATANNVSYYTSRVLVNGIQREVLSWSVDRDVTNDLPEQVVGGAGISQATGTVRWASKDVESGALNPWNPSTGWIPMDGDKVEIYAGDRSTEWKQFTGVIDTTNGSVGGSIESRVIDNIDKLSAVVDIPALMTGMPPLTEGGAWRRCGMSSRFTQNTALRTAGFHSTPAPEWDCVLDVPMQGSTWPVRGTLVSGSKRSDTSSAPPAYGSIWGSAIGDWTATYTPSIARPATTPVQITLMRTDAHADFGIVRVEYGSSAKSVALQLSSVNSAQALVNGTVVATVACTGNAIATVLYKNGTVTLKTSAGASQTVSAPTGATGNVTQIVTAGGVNSRCLGMQVSHPTDTGKEFTSLSFVPTAYIATGQMHTGNLVLPAVPGVPAREILEDIGAATLRPLWIDEYGKAVVTGSDTLYTKFSVQTVTTLDDIRELSWERNLLSVRSEIRTKYLKPTVNSRTTPSVEAWSQNESVVLQSGESQEVVIEPGTDEDWIMPDAGFEVLGTGGITNINKGATSVTAGVLTDGATESWATQTVPPALTVTVTQEAANRFVVKHVAGTLPAGNQVELRTVSENFVGTTALWPYWWGKQMPRLTAYAVVRWAEETRTPTVAGTRGPVLELDCGPWLSSGGTDTTAIDALSSFVAGQVTNPQPTIKGMRVGYDPRRQLGDVITVSSPNFMGVELRCLIVGISNSSGNSGYEQSLTVRVISATTTYTTYEQFVNAWGNSATYSNFLAAWDSISPYADFNQNPLRGTA